MFLGLLLEWFFSLFEKGPGCGESGIESGIRSVLLNVTLLGILCLIVAGLAFACVYFFGG